MPRGRAEHFPDLHEYVVRHASPEITRRQMLQMAQRDIDPGVNGYHIRRIYRLEHLPAKDGARWNLLVPDDKVEDFMKLIQGRTSMEVQSLAKEKLGLELTLAQIRTWKKNHKTPSGYDTRFRSGHTPDSKGKRWNEFMSKEAQERSKLNQFKKGNIPKNRKPLGEVFLRSDGYLWIKLQDGHLNDNWKQFHRYVWELENGPVPDGHKIIFLDGNRTNCEISNLMCVSDGVMSTANKWFGLGKDPEINKAIIKAAELKTAISKAQRRKEGKG